MDKLNLLLGEALSGYASLRFGMGQGLIVTQNGLPCLWLMGYPQAKRERILYRGYEEALQLSQIAKGFLMVSP